MRRGRKSNALPTYLLLAYCLGAFYDHRGPGEIMTRVPTRTIKEHIPGHEVSLSTYLNWGCRCEGCTLEHRRHNYKNRRKYSLAWQWLLRERPWVAKGLLMQAEDDARRKYG